ncbi:hypothetical protein KC359_g113 [Hortaea werneckii]|nr:hypothetical protein KC359_g113 [Hortaea werneckii]
MWSLGDKFVHIRMPFLIIVEKQVVPKGINEYSVGASFGEITAQMLNLGTALRPLKSIKFRLLDGEIFSTSNYDNLSSEGMVIGVTTLAGTAPSETRQSIRRPGLSQRTIKGSSRWRRCPSARNLGRGHEDRAGSSQRVGLQ